MNFDGEDDPESTSKYVIRDKQPRSVRLINKQNKRIIKSNVRVFLGATKHLYNWLCPLVGWLVGRSVGRQHIHSTIHMSHLIALLGLV